MNTVNQTTDKELNMNTPQQQEKIGLCFHHDLSVCVRQWQSFLCPKCFSNFLPPWGWRAMEQVLESEPNHVTGGIVNKSAMAYPVYTIPSGMLT